MNAIDGNDSHFGDRIAARAEKIGSWLVVGLDPDVRKFPARLVELAARSEDRLADLLFGFNRAVVDGTQDQAVAFKPQAAFYEQYGLAGLKALQKTLQLLRSRGLPSILDGKRNDIGSTAAAYAQAWLASERRLTPAASSPNEWQADAMTISPFLGRDGIVPFVQQAQLGGRGVFVLLRTSNPSGRELQCVLLSTGALLWQRLVELLAPEVERNRGQASGFSSLGFVVGATLPAGELSSIRGVLPHALFLMPGIGVQGGSIDSLRAARASRVAGVLPSASRSLLYPEGGRGSWPDRHPDPGTWFGEVGDYCSIQAQGLASQLQAVLFP